MHFIRGEHRDAQIYADRVSDISLHAASPYVAGYANLCNALLVIITQPNDTREGCAIDEAIALCDLREQGVHRGLRRHGLIARLFRCLHEASLHEKSVSTIEDLLSEARKSAGQSVDDNLLVKAYEAHIRVMIGDIDSARGIAYTIIGEPAMKIPWHPAMRIVGGWCDIVEFGTAREAAIKLIQTGIAECESMNHYIGMPLRKGMHADALRRLGRPEEAREIVVQQIEACQADYGEKIWLPPLETLRDVLADPALAKNPPQGFRGCFVR